jgi:hypothetical protein
MLPSHVLHPFINGFGQRSVANPIVNAALISGIMIEEEDDEIFDFRLYKPQQHVFH